MTILTFFSDVQSRVFFFFFFLDMLDRNLLNEALRKIREKYEIRRLSLMERNFQISMCKKFTNRVQFCKIGSSV